jgi:opacity protein-like surface antigen
LFPFAEAFTTAAGQSFSPSASGAIWGGHLGVNYQIRHFVIGAEASYAGGRLSESITGPFAVAPQDHFAIGATDLFTTTGRIGLLTFHDQYLFYGKGGYASSLVEVNATSSTGVTARASHRENGWLIGAGLESRMVSNIIFGLEYNYLSFSGDRISGVTGALDQLRRSISTSTIYRCTPSPHVSASYSGHMRAAAKGCWANIK